MVDLKFTKTTAMEKISLRLDLSQFRFEIQIYRNSPPLSHRPFTPIPPPGHWANSLWPLSKDTQEGLDGKRLLRLTAKILADFRIMMVNVFPLWLPVYD